MRGSPGQELKLTPGETWDPTIHMFFDRSRWLVK